MMINASKNVKTKTYVQFIKQHNHHRETTRTNMNDQSVICKMLLSGLSKYSEEINKDRKNSIFRS